MSDGEQESGMNLAILKKYGEFCSSWALWNYDRDSQAFPCYSDNELLSMVNTNYVFVGLNPSRQPVGRIDCDCSKNDNKELWRSFHCDSPNDGKLKYLFADRRGEQYRGSYFTDIIKVNLAGEPFIQGDSSQVVDGLNKNSELIKKNAIIFKTELNALECEPLIIAFGRKTYSIIRFAIRRGYLEYDKDKVKFVYHYSYRFRGYDDASKYGGYLLDKLDSFLQNEP